MNLKKVLLGCDVLIAEKPEWFSTKRLGLLANQASVNGELVHTGELISRHGGKLTCLFSPQHGFFGEKQANMQESPDSWDSFLDLPVFSLYGVFRQPSKEMLSHLDVLIVDLVDVGTRVYTFGTTMGLCLEAAGAQGLKVVVLDRPNPIGGNLIEGNLVVDGYRSFVGRYPIPMRHGLTMGELARYIVMECGVNCDLEVVPMKGWSRKDFYPDLGLPWIFPSPNMPSWETSMLYPGMVMLEGTNVSEGRGTTLPFQLFGAPFIDHRRFLDVLQKMPLEGVVFRPVCFEPVFDKWVGQTCRGFQIHITDRERLRPYRLGLALLRAFMLTNPDEFKWLEPPYEYEWEKKPIDIILGDSRIRKELEKGTGLLDLEATWRIDLDQYDKKRTKYLSYQ